MNKKLISYVFFFLFANGIIGSIDVFANNEEINSKFSQVEFLGLEDKQFLTGEVFEIKKNVMLLMNNEEINLKNLVVTNSKEQDISNVQSIKLSYSGTYVYSYKYLDREGQLHVENRTITVVNPTQTTAEVKQQSERDITINYIIKNEYKENVNVFLQDWSLFPINHDEKITLLESEHLFLFEKAFEVVPVFEKVESSIVPPLNNDPSENPDSHILYTKTGQLDFQPTFSFMSEKNEEELSRFYVNTGIDMTDLVQKNKFLAELIEVKTFMLRDKVVLGEKATLYYEVINTSPMSFQLKVSDWDYYGKFIKVPLGDVDSGERGLFKQQIIVTQELVDESMMLKKSIPSIYFLTEGTEQFVINTTNNGESTPGVVIEYVDESGNKLHEDSFIQGEYGDTYQSTPIDIINYRVKEPFPTNESGFFGNEIIIVTYVYEKRLENIEEEIIDSELTTPSLPISTGPDSSIAVFQNKHKEIQLQLPKTGEKTRMNTTYLLILVSLLVSVIIFCRGKILRTT